jgi:hypothetical protein
VRLERDKALFSDSRLYRQAEEIAEDLLLNLQVPVPLADAVSCIREEGIELTFRPGDLDRPIGVLHGAIERGIDSVSPTTPSLRCSARWRALAIPARPHPSRSRPWRSVFSAGCGPMSQACRRHG